MVALPVSKTKKSATASMAKRCAERCEFTLGSQTLELSIPYQPPFDWEWILGFIQAHEISGVEAVHCRKYLRIVATTDGGVGFLEIAQPDQSIPELKVKLSSNLANQTDKIIDKVRHLFDLDVSPLEISAHLGILANRPGIRVPGAFDSFELSVRTILGQLVNMQNANTFMNRFVLNYGTRIVDPFDQLFLACPQPEQISAVDPDDLSSRVNIPRKRGEAIVNLAKAIASGDLLLDGNADPADVVHNMVNIPGVGPWTAHYIAMRALHWHDAFPSGDFAVRKVLGETSDKSVLAAAKKWQPWRAYAVMHIWDSYMGRQAKADI